MSQRDAVDSLNAGVAFSIELEATPGSAHPDSFRMIDSQPTAQYGMQYIGQELEMSVRTVRLDDDAEATLTALRKQTGLSISDVLKRGLESYAKAVREEVAETPLRYLSPIGSGTGRLCRGPGKRCQGRSSRDPKREAPAVILVDTGPLVALFDPADGAHGRCVEVLETIRELSPRPYRS